MGIIILYHFEGIFTEKPTTCKRIKGDFAPFKQHLKFVNAYKFRENQLI